MGLTLSRSSETSERVRSLEQQLEHLGACVARLPMLEVGYNQLRSEVDTFRAGKRKLEQRVEDLSHGLAAAATQPAKRQKVSKLETIVLAVAAGEGSSARADTGAEGVLTPAQQEDEPAKQPPSASVAKEVDASQPGKEAEENPADKSPAPSLPSDAVAAGNPVSGSRKRSARSARSKVKPAVSPSTSAAVSDKPSAAATATSEKVALTIAQIKTWLEDNGFADEAERLSKNGARKPEWVAVYKEKLSGEEAE